MSDIISDKQFLRLSKQYTQFIYRGVKVKIELDKRRWDLLRRLESRYRFSRYFKYYFRKGFWQYMQLRFTMENKRVLLLPYEQKAKPQHDYYKTLISVREAVEEIKKLNLYEMRLMKNCKRGLLLFENIIMKKIVTKKSMPADVKEAIVHALKLINGLKLRIKDHHVRLHMMNDYLDKKDVQSFLRLSEFYFDDYSFYFPLHTFEDRLSYHTHRNYLLYAQRLDALKKVTYKGHPFVGEILYNLMLFVKSKDLFFGVRKELL